MSNKKQIPLHMTESLQPHDIYRSEYIYPFTMSLSKPLRLLLLGAPGAGKGTQTSRLLKKISGLQSLSSGDVLRQEITGSSAAGKSISQYIEQGRLVPDDIMIDLIYGNLKTRGWLSPNSSWLLDGFPRTVNQARSLEDRLKDSKLNLVVELQVPEEVILDRIEKRWVHIPSGRVYNMDYNPPKEFGKDDVTGEPLTRRSDDTAGVFKERMASYHKELTPLKEFYGKEGIFNSVEGETSDILFPKLYDLILKKFG